MVSSLTTAALFALVVAAGPGGAATTLTPGVKEVSQDAVTVTWGRTQDMCFTSYDIQWRAAGGTSWATATSLTETGRTEYRLTGLTPETAYEVRVVDVDCLGSQPSDPVPFTTTALRPGGITDAQFQWIALVAAAAVAVAIMLFLRARAHRARLSRSELIVRIDGDGGAHNCVYCGKPVASQYCGNCGAKQN